jgi:nickel-dependent lactate racemase
MTSKICKIPYGKKFIEIEFNGDFNVYKLQPNNVKPARNDFLEVLKALDNPVSHAALRNFRNVDNIAVVVSDQTRTAPSALMLEALLKKLREYNVDWSQITVIVGGGLHPPCDKKTVREILGESIIDRVGKILVHNANNEDELVFLGYTSRNTPIWVNRYYIEAQKRIVTGVIEPHQFMGYTGGAKGVAIGLGGAKTIEKNHSLMLSPDARLGVIEGNPAREDVDEIGKRIKIDLLLNTILNNEKQVVKAVAGHWLKAHRAGVEFCRKIVEVSAPYVADLVIASPGGHPKDLNLYQAQKALTSAEIVSKPNGVIVLVAECSQGFGDEAFEKTMRELSTPEEIIEYFKNQGFKMGVHKAYLWAKAAIKRKVIVVSDKLKSETAEALKVDLSTDLENAVREAMKLTEVKSIIIMPNASTTVPKVQVNAVNK